MFIFVPVQDAKSPRNYQHRQEEKSSLSVISKTNKRVCLSTLSKIVFSDECIFRLNGSINTQKVRIWGTERPVEGRQTFSHSPSIMVWCGIAKEKIIGPYFSQDQNVKGDNYWDMLIQYAFLRLASIRADYIFHQDGAPARYSSRARTNLDNKRPGNWIWRGGPVEWPPRSPDLVPCDFSVGSFERKSVRYCCSLHGRS